MPWYSMIYIFLRDRERNPCKDIFRLLFYIHFLWLFALVGYTYYAYVLNLYFEELTSPILSYVYIVVYHIILFLMLLSLLRLLLTRTARVPQEYYVGAEVDDQLKGVTPKTDDKFMPDLSTNEQIQEQRELLDKFAMLNQLNCNEVDRFNRLRYCYICRLIKPDRCQHCSLCGICVLKFDHHCPWFNKCISFSNYKFFILYMFYGFLLGLWIVITGAECLIRHILFRTWHQNLLNIALAIAVLACIIFALYPMKQLLSYHLNMILLNKTSCELVRQLYIRGDENATYDLGKYKNFREAMGWGFWGLPINTPVSNGLYFQIR